jgi:hypothetical protein
MLPAVTSLDPDTGAGQAGIPYIIDAFAASETHSLVDCHFESDLVELMLG